MCACVCVCVCVCTPQAAADGLAGTMCGLLHHGPAGCVYAVYAAVRGGGREGRGGREAAGWLSCGGRGIHLGRGGAVTACVTCTRVHACPVIDLGGCAAVAAGASAVPPRGGASEGRAKR